MKSTRKYLGKAFVIASMYLVVIIVGGFFILPGVFHIDDYQFPAGVEIILKLAAVISVLLILLSAMLIPVLTSRIPIKSKGAGRSPVFMASVTMLVGLFVVFADGLYVKLRTCSAGDTGWYCHVESKSYVGMLALAFFVAVLVGSLAWLLQTAKSLKH